jgi:DNA-binding NtrC family response regulator
MKITMDCPQRMHGGEQRSATCEPIRGRATCATCRTASSARSSSAREYSLAQIDLAGTMSEAVKRVTAIVERTKLEEALKNARGNKERAADALQISYKALQREHGVPD